MSRCGECSGRISGLRRRYLKRCANDIIGGRQYRQYLVVKLEVTVALAPVAAALRQPQNITAAAFMHRAGLLAACVSVVNGAACIIGHDCRVQSNRENRLSKPAFGNRIGQQPTVFAFLRYLNRHRAIFLFFLRTDCIRRRQIKSRFPLRIRQMHGFGFVLHQRQSVGLQAELHRLHLLQRREYNFILKLFALNLAAPIHSRKNFFIHRFRFQLMLRAQQLAEKRLHFLLKILLRRDLRPLHELPADFLLAVIGQLHEIFLQPNLQFAVRRIPQAVRQLHQTVVDAPIHLVRCIPIMDSFRVNHRSKMVFAQLKYFAHFGATLFGFRKPFAIGGKPLGKGHLKRRFHWGICLGFHTFFLPFRLFLKDSRAACLHAALPLCSGLCVLYSVVGLFLWAVMKTSSRF